MSRSPAQFAVRTMRALEVLAFMPGTAPQVADALGVHPKTARRLLSQLQRDGWLWFSDQWPRVYSPTLRFVALAAQIGSQAPLATLTAPAVKALHENTGEEASLAIPSYRATVCVVRCVGGHAVQPPLGDVLPAHCTAAGKVLLAHREAWRRSVLDAAPPTACTRRTIVTAEALERELEQVRRDGYATEEGEHVDGVRQVAAPVAGPGREVVAAITSRVPARESLAEISDAVVAAGTSASEAILRGAGRYPLQRGIVYRLLASYGLAAVDAHI